MIKFEDVAHYYYGQTILKHKSSNDNDPLYKINETRITFGCTNFIPVLKRFSYANAEVQKELGKIHHCEDNKLKIPIEISALKINYLLSQGFDLFGLIDSGEAIEKEATNGTKIS